MVICFIVLIMILYLLIMNRGKLIFKLALFVYLFFSNHVENFNVMNLFNVCTNVVVVGKINRSSSSSSSMSPVASVCPSNTGSQQVH